MFNVLKAKSSNSDFTDDIPNLCAKGEYTSLVSIAIRRCFILDKYSIVFMLWILSANLMITTLMSLATDNSIFIKFPACFSLRELNSMPLILVRPSTRLARSLSNSFSRSFMVIFVSSTTSCSSPAMIVL